MSMEIQTHNVDGLTAPKAGGASGLLGKDDFLKLLVMQLRFQDPLSPMKGTEFAAQLAQFSSVEQLSNMNTNILQSIDANALLTRSINNALAATFIDKEVRASADAFHYNGGGDLQLGYNLLSSAETVLVKIYDEGGNLVKTLTGTGKNKGDNTFTWDGKNAQGHPVAPGRYTFSVEAKDSNGASISAARFIFGLVTGVRFKAEGTVFVIGDVEISLSDILEIMKR